MTRIATIILVIGIALSTEIGASVASSSPNRGEVPPTLVVSGGDSSQMEAVTWALDRYAEAGLELPPLTIRIHASRGGCSGNRGLYHEIDAVDVVELCDTSMPVILHEFAHAWTAQHLSEQARMAFLAHEGVTRWSGSDVAYDERGTELAAQTMSLCLAERPLSSMDATRYARYLEGYEILTGLPSPRLASPAGD